MWRDIRSEWRDTSRKPGIADISRVQPGRNVWAALTRERKTSDMVDSTPRSRGTRDSQQLRSYTQIQIYSYTRTQRIHTANLATLSATVANHPIGSFQGSPARKQIKGPGAKGGVRTGQPNIANYIFCPQLCRTPNLHCDHICQR